MEFDVEIFHGGAVGDDVLAEEPGADDVVVGEFIAMGFGKGECFGDERGVWDGYAGEDSGGEVCWHDDFCSS